MESFRLCLIKIVRVAHNSSKSISLDITETINRHKILKSDTIPAVTMSYIPDSYEHLQPLENPLRNFLPIYAHQRGQKQRFDIELARCSHPLGSLQL